MNEEKFCKDCNCHFVDPLKPDNPPTCTSGQYEPQVDLVSGEVRLVTCHDARWNEILCGIEAKWFEKK